PNRRIMRAVNSPSKRVEPITRMSRSGHREVAAKVHWCQNEYTNGRCSSLTGEFGSQETEKRMVGPMRRTAMVVAQEMSVRRRSCERVKGGRSPTGSAVARVGLALTSTL